MSLKHKRGFTLIELLVVVLVIAILAAVALPQYNKAVEKARMAEAVANVRAIAHAHQRYYLEHDAYLKSNEIGKLDIEIPGTVNTSWSAGRIKTKDFIYSPGTTVAAMYLALAQRVSRAGEDLKVYFIYISPENPQRIRCTFYVGGSGTAIQQKLCQSLDSKGYL